MKLIKLFVVIAIIFQSCTKDEFNRQETNDSVLDEIQKKFDVESEFVFAHLNITKNEEVMINLSYDLNNFEKNVFSDIIVLANTSSDHEIKSISLGYCRILSLNGLTIISTENDETINLIVNNSSGVETFFMLKNNFKYKIDDENSYVGYGLSYLKGNWISPKSLSNTIINSAFEYVKTNSTLKQEEIKSKLALTCISGGQGATSCQITEGAGSVNQGCSVTCGAGYYACCDNTGINICQCVSTGEGEGECKGTVCLIPF